MELVEALKGSAAESFVKMVKLNIQDVGRRFFEIGFRLYEANEFKYYEELGYNSIEELAEVEFGFKRSSTFQYIQVFKSFADFEYKETQYGWRDKVLLKNIRSEFKDYTYSQLVELCKLNYMPQNVNDIIPVSTSVRDIAAYVKYKNSCYGGNYLSLPNWKEEIQKPALEAEKNVKEQIAIPESVLKCNTDDKLESSPDYVLNDKEKKDKKQLYDFSTRAGVRTFLSDYQSWKKYAKTWGSPYFKAVYGFVFKNGKYIMACESNVYEGLNVSLGRATIKVTYFVVLNNDDGFTEITKGQFEEYCAEHKDEL